MSLRVIKWGMILSAQEAVSAIAPLFESESRRIVSDLTLESKMKLSQQATEMLTTCSLIKEAG